MHKKLSQIGSSWGFIIPKAIIELINLNPIEDEIEIIINGDEIKIKKYVQEDKRKLF